MPGNKCLFYPYRNFSQCVADPNQYLNSWWSKCVNTCEDDRESICCDPGATCNEKGVCTQPEYPSCAKPTSFDSRYQQPSDVPTSPTLSPSTVVIGVLPYHGLNAVVLVAVVETLIILLGIIWAVRLWFLTVPGNNDDNDPADVENTVVTYQGGGRLVPYNDARQLVVRGEEEDEGGEGHLVRYHNRGGAVVGDSQSLRVASNNHTPLLQFLNPFASTTTTTTAARNNNEEQIQLINNQTGTSYS